MTFFFFSFEKIGIKKPVSEWKWTNNIYTIYWTNGGMAEWRWKTSNKIGYDSILIGIRHDLSQLSNWVQLLRLSNFTKTRMMKQMKLLANGVFVFSKINEYTSESFFVLFLNRKLNPNEWRLIDMDNGETSNSRVTRAKWIVGLYVWNLILHYFLLIH